MGNLCTKSEPATNLVDANDNDDANLTFSQKYTVGNDELGEIDELLILSSFNHSLSSFSQVKVPMVL